MHKDYFFDRISKLHQKLGNTSNWEDKYKTIINFGKDMPLMDEAYKTEENKVKGCQSQVWLHCWSEEGLLRFSGDSDAAIVKGLVAILLSVYDKSPADEILKFKAQFIDELGLRQHLSMSRANGLNAMLKQIVIYAMAFKAKESL